MKIDQIIRAWKHQTYRQNSSQAEWAELPPHPAGMIELTEADLGVVSGGATTANCNNTHQAHCTATHWWVCTFHPCS